jgi:AraC-like DNA-binding protein
MQNNIYIYSESDILKRELLNKPYRPQNQLLLILKKGKISFKKNIAFFEITENSLLIIRPKDIIEFTYISSEIEIRILKFKKEFTSKITFNFNRYDTYQLMNSEHHNQFKITEFETEQLWNLTELLKNVSPKTANNKFLAQTQKHLFLSLAYSVASVLKKYVTITEQKMNRKETIVMDFLHLLSVHFKNEREVKFYANTMNLSVRYLSTVLKEITGFSANKMIHQSVITEAKVLLKSTNKTINEIAHELNFNDQYYFSNFFKSQTGQNPSNFRLNG